MPTPIIYAIGDVHGELDLLTDILEKIQNYHVKNAHRPAWVVTLGDYVDRGPNSAGVIDLLLSDSEKLFWFSQRVHLRGNHEQMMLDALASGHRDELERWLWNGGEETLASYGATSNDLSAIPANHLNWLEQLPLTFEVGELQFVHAGVAPNRPLDQQREIDLLWIRDEFLEDDRRLAKRIVHGHTREEDQPVILPNRIGLDTGSGYPGGRLSCVVLDPDDPWGDPVATFGATL